MFFFLLMYYMNSHFVNNNKSFLNYPTNDNIKTHICINTSVENVALKKTVCVQALVRKYPTVKVSTCSKRNVSKRDGRGGQARTGG